MLIMGSGDLECLGGLGSEIIVFCLRGKVAVGEAGGRLGLRGFGVSTVGDLAGFLVGMGGVCVVGMLSKRPCNT